MKKIQWIFYVGICLLSISFLSSCDKEDDHDHDSVVSIDISSPTTGTEYHLGDTVTISITVTGSSQLHGYEVNIYNTSDSDTSVYTIQVHDHLEAYSIQDDWVNDVTSHSDMQLEVTVFTDHDGTSETETVNFHCHPM